MIVEAITFTELMAQTGDPHYYHLWRNARVDLLLEDQAQGLCTITRRFNAEQHMHEVVAEYHLLEDEMLRKLTL